MKTNNDNLQTSTSSIKLANYIPLLYWFNNPNEPIPLLAYKIALQEQLKYNKIDYNKIKLENKQLNKEIIKYVFHPKRVKEWMFEELN